jgi:hypothetical protein
LALPLSEVRKGKGEDVKFYDQEAEEEWYAAAALRAEQELSYHNRACRMCLPSSAIYCNHGERLAGQSEAALNNLRKVRQKNGKN